MLRRLLLPEIARNIERRFSLLNINVGCVEYGSDLYDAVLGVAGRAYKRPRHELTVDSDPYSEIYAAVRDAQVIATVTATRASEGPIETEDVFPETLLAERRQVIVYSYRLAVAASGGPADSQLGRLMMRVLFADQILARGRRLGFITTSIGLASYYHRAGFLPIKGAAFVHPRLGTMHLPMLYPCHPHHRGLFTDLCESLPEPLPLNAIANYLEQAAPAGALAGSNPCCLRPGTTSSLRLSLE